MLLCMTNRRDRHLRGMRGPVSLPNPYTVRPVDVPTMLTNSQFFISCVRDSISSVERHCPEALEHVDIGTEDVPTVGLGVAGIGDQVPLTAAVEATAQSAARIVIFRRPLERRAYNRAELKQLVHVTLVEQLSVVRNIPMHQIDPDIESKL